MAPPGCLTGPVLVGSSTDGVLERVREELERRGHAATVLGPGAYARRVSVTITGCRARVEPDVPLLLRARGAQEEDACAVAEALALAGALSASPVVNRPAPALPAAPSSREALEYLMCAGRLHPSLLVDERRSDGGPVDGAAFEQEPLPGGQGGGGPGTAVRFRERMPAGWVYQKVLVVGNRCWLYHETVAAAPEIRRLSLEAAAAAGLAFCCLYWRAALRGPGRSGLQLRLARVSPQPTEAELADLAGAAVSAVADLLLA
ncbi:hypothetical protein ACLMMA_02410 [Micrococcus luteus]